MSAFSQDQIARIGAADDLHISPFRDDGVTPGTPTWIWSVVVDGALYVRAYNGTSSRWYRAALKKGAGRIKVAGMTLDVAFTPETGSVNDAVDTAYRAKYPTSPYVGHMVGAKAKAATVRLEPLS